MSISREGYMLDRNLPMFIALTLVAAITLLIPSNSGAQSNSRSGKEVVDTVCSECHITGAQGAPKIGDVTVWSKRASQGLTMLTTHAINGIRQMPGHGGNPGVTDFEIKRAITYMVNQSGGFWAEPIDKDSLPPERSGEQIVQTHCARCHKTAVEGAPRIGDQADWAQRMSRGLDVLVRSAINGHGGMPSRGGIANLTDPELRSAVLYMFNPASVTAKHPSALHPMVSNQLHKVIGGMTVYLGVIPVESLRREERSLHGGFPIGKGYYHLNVSLQDSKTNHQISDAEVVLTVKDPVMGGETKKLDIITIDNFISYGNYFRLQGWDTYTITLHIHRPGISQTIEATFDLHSLR